MQHVLMRWSRRSVSRERDAVFWRTLITLGSSTSWQRSIFQQLCKGRSYSCCGIVVPMKEDHLSLTDGTASGESTVPQKAGCGCRDALCVLLFLPLFAVVFVYGIIGLDELYNSSVCIHITPPTTTNLNLLGTYENCFRPAVRGSETAGALCTSFAVNSIVESAGDVPPELEPAIELIEGGYEQCLAFVAAGDNDAIEKCLMFGLGEVSELLGSDESLDGDSRSKRQKGREAWTACSQLDSSNTTAEEVQSCIRRALQTFLGENTVATLDANCVAPTISLFDGVIANQLDAGRQCLGDLIRSIEDAIPSALLVAWDECLSPLSKGSTEAAASCLTFGLSGTVEQLALLAGASVQSADAAIAEAKAWWQTCKGASNGPFDACVADVLGRLPLPTGVISDADINVLRSDCIGPFTTELAVVARSLLSLQESLSCVDDALLPSYGISSAEIQAAVNQGVATCADARMGFMALLEGRDGAIYIATCFTSEVSNALSSNLVGASAQLAAEISSAAKSAQGCVAATVTAGLANAVTLARESSNAGEACAQSVLDLATTKLAEASKVVRLFDQESAQLSVTSAVTALFENGPDSAGGGGCITPLNGYKIMVKGETEETLEPMLGVAIAVDSATDSAALAVRNSIDCVGEAAKGALDAAISEAYDQYAAAERCVQTVLSIPGGKLGPNDMVALLRTALSIALSESRRQLEGSSTINRQERILQESDTGNFDSIDDECLSSLLSLDVTETLGCLVSSLRQLTGLARPVCEDLEETAKNSFSDKWGDSESDSIGERMWEDREKVAKVVALIFVSGFVMALMLLTIIGRNAELLIKCIIFLTLTNLLVVGIFNLAIGNIPGAVLTLLYLMWKMFWFWWIRNEIKFAVQILKTSLMAIKCQPAPFLLSALVLFLEVAWSAIAFGAFYKLKDVAGNFGYVLLVFVFFWGIEVMRGIVAVTISSTVTHWYRHTGSILVPQWCVTLLAFAKSLTIYLGSICFGSLLVAALSTARYFIARAKKTKRKWLKALLLLVFGCLKDWAETFNTYAYVNVAANGMSYCGSAYATLALFKRHGLTAIANDDLIESILKAARLMSAFTCACLAGIFSRSYQDLDWDIVAALSIVAWIFGWVTMSVVEDVVTISSATLLVCFAQEPHTLKISHPDIHENLIKAWRARHKGEPGMEAFLKRCEEPEVVETGKALRGNDRKCTDLAVSAGRVELVEVGTTATNQRLPKRRVMEVEAADAFVSWVMSEPRKIKFVGTGNGELEKRWFGLRTGSNQILKFESGNGDVGDAAPLSLRWKEGEGGLCRIHDITAVKLGAATDDLRDNVKQSQHQQCFVILARVTTVGDKSKLRVPLQLGFDAGNPEMASKWVAGLKAVITNERAKLTVASSFMEGATRAGGLFATVAGGDTAVGFVLRKHTLFSIFCRPQNKVEKDMPRWASFHVFCMLLLANLLYVLLFEDVDIVNSAKIVIIVILLIPTRLLLNYLMRRFALSEPPTVTRMIAVSLLIATTLSGLIGYQTSTMSKDSNINDSISTFFVSWAISTFVVQILVLLFIFSCCAKCCPCCVRFVDGK